MSDKRALLPALITQAIYYVLTVLSWFDYGVTEGGHGLAFLFWIISLVPALFAIFFHALGAILNISRERRLVPILYLILSVGALPLLFTVGTGYSVAESILWNAYFFALVLIPLCFCLKKNG